MNWQVVTELSPPAVLAHWGTVMVAFLAGVAALSLKKGSGTHKAAGRTYAAMMVVTAVAAFFVRSPEPNSALGYLSLTGMSWIHLFVPLTLLTVPLGVLAARRHDVRAHKRHMIGSFPGALIIAGAFTFLPGRRMHLLFFAEPEVVDGYVERVRGAD